MPGKAVPLRTLTDVVAARQACREVARDLGFGSADQTRLATAVSELVRNAIRHAGEGTCVITYESDSTISVVRVVVEDHGPGIEDLHQAMTPGFTTSGGLGAGLPAAKRLVHEFNIESQPGMTVVSLTMKRRSQCKI